MTRNVLDKILVPFCIVALVLSAFMPRAQRFGYEYRTGAIWRYPTLTAEFDFPVFKTESQLLQEEAEQALSEVPLFVYQANVPMRLIDALRVSRMDDRERIPIRNSLQAIYRKGVVQDEEQHIWREGSAGVETILLSRGKKAVEVPAREVYTVSSAKMRLLADLQEIFPGADVDSLLRVNGIYSLVKPNLIYDKSGEGVQGSLRRSQVSPTSGYVRQGQVVVSKGELVTAETSRMLDSYKREFNEVMGSSSASVPLSWAGSVIMGFALAAILFYALCVINKSVFLDPNKFYFLLTVFLLSSLAALIVGQVNPEMAAMIPFPVFAMYLRAFFHSRETLAIYAVSILPLLLMDGGQVYFLMFLAAGVTVVPLYRNFNRGLKQFVTIGAAFLTLATVYLAFSFLGVEDTDVTVVMARLFAGSVLTVLAYTLIYVFERIFNLVSESRLQDLCDTSKDLLHEMEQKAPGTFQHSLQVMNMADAVARAIKADDYLVRAGAMYHDIGKILNPSCFIENEPFVEHQADSTYHAGKLPLQSARDIISHVTDGLMLAKKHHLPAPIAEFIKTHHGTSATAYFLDKYLENGGDPGRASAFRYPGIKPTSTEQVILMLCDSVEAAARTVKTYTAEEFDNLVEKIVRAKIDDGQLDSAAVTLKHLYTIKAVMKNYLAQIYHERIAYPDTGK